MAARLPGSNSSAWFFASSGRPPHPRTAGAHESCFHSRGIISLLCRAAFFDGEPDPLHRKTLSWLSTPRHRPASDSRYRSYGQPPSLSEAKVDRLRNQLSDLEDAKLKQPARSLDGSRAKTLIAARDMQAPDDRGLRTHEVLGRFVQVAWLVCPVPLSAHASDEGAVLQMAHRTMVQRRLLSRAELACSCFVLQEGTKTVATVPVREKHGGKCGGAPEAAPRRFTTEIDLKTGAARWGRDDAKTIRPIPKPGSAKQLRCFHNEGA